MYDIAIVGGGVVGALTARELMRYNVSVCVLEKENDVACGATKANSAIVHAGFDAHPGTLKAKLNVRGSQMMPFVAAELGVKYKNNGSLVVGYCDDDIAVLNELLERGNKNGVEGLRLIDADELHGMEPNLSAKAICALYAPSGAIVCPYELCIAAMGNAMDNGAELICGFEVKDIESADGGYIVKSDRSEIRARCIVNAAGMYADNVAKMIGDESFNIHPRRGEYILLDKECGNITNCTVFQTPTAKGKGILVSPTVDGNYIFGPTAVDICDKEDKSTTQSGFSKILSEVSGVLAQITRGKAITSFCGLRAVGNTGDFIINIRGGNFVNVAGIESPGLSASPAIAEYVAELLKGSGIFKGKNKSFDPIRTPSHLFRNAPDEIKNEMIKARPDYGKIVCRCEQVTEGEIVDAIRTNPPAHDIDGIKRRTRAGMGRCQSGFCMPYVAKILSRELNIPLEHVTKSGGKSNIIIGRTKGEQR